MKKSAFVLFFAALFSVASFAQSVQDGVNHLYAERYQGAKSTFEKMVASNPNNIEANYWLGQTHIASGDVAAARSVYQKAAASSSNAPLLRVGMGHVLLLEGKTAEARAEFEAALTASKGRKGNDPTILNAIGRANVDAAGSKAKSGDINYAVAKLTEASQLAPTNAEILLNLGNAYLKTPNGGGQAVTAYTKATQVNPKFAPAFYRMAKIYATQKNWEIFSRDLNNAIQADPTFAPAYYELYYYNLPRDLTVAEDFANKFIKNADPGVQNDYLKA
ncbi:MAG TPA: tetratricopeptide repeat protein, partial [Chitinophagaceae bacterium]|nr:tetratricopeptide repeat protein [Chitinophagaceae bacterium]